MEWLGQPTDSQPQAATARRLLAQAEILKFVSQKISHFVSCSVRLYLFLSDVSAETELFFKLILVILPPAKVLAFINLGIKI